MITWLLVFQLGYSSFVTVPGIVSEKECQALAVKLKSATGPSYQPFCLSYYKTP